MGFRLHSIALAIWATVLAFTASGCLGVVKEDGDVMERVLLAGQLQNSAPTSIVDAFAKTLHPLLRSQCASCHGSSQGPLFALANVADAYAVMAQSALYDFNLPGNSKIVRKSSDNHCGSGCTGNSTAFTAKIQEWSVKASGSSGGPSGPNPSPSPSSPAPPAGSASLKTGTFLVPANLSTTQATTFTYALGGLVGGLNGVNLLVDVVRLNANTQAYVLRNLRMTFPNGSTVSAYFEGVYATVNGVVEANATTWAELAAIASVSTSGRAFSQSVMVVAGDKGLGVDQLGLALSVLQLANPNCSNVAANSPFVAQIRPVLIQKCASCHGNQAIFRINNGDANQDLCNRTLQRVDFGTPRQSGLIALPEDGARTRSGGAHPTTEIYSQGEIDAIINWINIEAAAR